MARYKDYNPEQDRFIAVSFRDQIIPGSFEHTLCQVIDHHVDMKPFAARYSNDKTGRLAYDPAVLLKIVLYGYYKGLISSRRIAETCEVNVNFMAISAETKPHFTTIANFVAKMDREIVRVFTDVLTYAYALNLIGKDTFAIDGCKLPSNASKQWSGTFYELKHKQTKLQTAAQTILARHRERDDAEKQTPMAIQDEKKLQTFERTVDKIKTFLQQHKQNIGPSGKERKSNITDPQSAKMSTNHGVIQGYNGVAVVDEKHQLIIQAEAHGEGQEAHLLKTMIESTEDQCKAAGIDNDIFKKTKLTADAGYNSQDSVKYTQERNIDAYIADRHYRQRDPAFADYDRYKERTRNEKRNRAGDHGGCFTPKDFEFDEDNRTCRCPAGHALYRAGKEIHVQNLVGMKFRGTKSECGSCELRAKCLRHPDRTPQRQVVFFTEQTQRKHERPIDKMKRKFDTLVGRFIYHKRIAIVEPVFGNLKNKGMNRFTLRGKAKVNAQWKMFALVHNIEKIAHCGER